MEQTTPDSLIKFVRMNSGEDLIAEVIANKGKYTLVNPLKIVYLLGDRPGSLMLSLIEWVFPRICSKQEFTVLSSDVMMVSDPTEDITNYYFDALYKLANTSDFEFDKTYSATTKMKKSVEKAESIEPEILSSEEMEVYNQIMDAVKQNKRKLH